MTTPEKQVVTLERHFIQHVVGLSMFARTEPFLCMIMIWDNDLFFYLVEDLTAQSVSCHMVLSSMDCLINTIS